jgi:hypothetical protein
MNETPLDYLRSFFETELNEVAQVFYQYRDAKNDAVQPEFLRKSEKHHYYKALKHLAAGLNSYIDEESGLSAFSQSIARILCCMKLKNIKEEQNAKSPSL